MKKFIRYSKLNTELRSVGSSDEEITSLINIANRLGELKGGKLPIKNAHRRLKISVLVAIPSISALAVGMFIVIASQTVLPGSPLYPVQKTSDSVATLLDPSYKATVMMRKADQVQALVNKHASSSKVLSTLSDYQNLAVSYKSQSANYRAFEYCEHSLEQAATNASKIEKQAIQKDLQALNTA